MVQEIPAEITLKILDLNENDIDSLNTMSLVCKDWRQYSQKCLFQTLKLTIRPAKRTSAQRLQGLAAASSAGIRGHVKTLVLKLPETSIKKAGIWLRAHEELLVQVLRALPSERLTSFTLENRWSTFDYQVNDQESIPLFPSIVRCIDDICASPILERLALEGKLPCLRLLSRCGPALKELHTSHLQAPSPAGSRLPQSYLPLERRDPINLEALTVHYPKSQRSNHGVPREGEGSLSGYLFNPRSLFNLGSLKHLEVLGEASFDEPFCQLFATCIGSLESLIVRSLPTHPNTLGLRKARNLKRLSFLCPNGHSNLTSFMGWLLVELTSYQAHSHHVHPSSLEFITLRLRVFSYVTQFEPSLAGRLSDILSDEHHYPRIKQVKFGLIPDCPTFEWTTDEDIDVANKHREKIELAMHALKEKRVLQLQWWRN
ncbi:hypothetical protein BKA70DRAFT_1430075 [Coprinopsis sp. MPI-PUGE-AT-0042]|nr:hypothetical protein BKA70DRAFT_1430075 [Coprinopsis sp. MPI-PUGE-AT-0042]